MRSNTAAWSLGFKKSMVIFGLGLLFANSLASQASEVPISLRIKVESSDGKISAWKINCNPNGGNHPAVTKSCNLLQSTRGKSLLFPKPKDICSQIYGGAAKASIRGKYGNKEVALTLSRQDGCKIKQWDNLLTLLRSK